MPLSVSTVHKENYLLRDSLIFKMNHIYKYNSI